MKEVVILGAARTAGGRFGGSLASMTAPEFGALVVRETIKRSGIPPDEIDQTIFGNAWQAGVGPNPARITAVHGGVPFDAPAVSINVRCGSSIQALIFGVQAIKANDAETVLVGGTESSSSRARAAKDASTASWKTARTPSSCATSSGEPPRRTFRPSDVVNQPGVHAVFGGL